MSQLVSFFNKNTTYREHFLKHKLIFDAQLEFAKSDQRLLIYEPEYDQDGFDLIFDNLCLTRHIQTKSILFPAKTHKWKVHRSLLRPGFPELNILPVSEDSYGVGYGGGVLIINARFNKNNILETSYLFSDALIISAMYLGILTHKNSRHHDNVVRFAKTLFSPYEIGGRVYISKSCFLNFTDLSELFAYCGFSLKNKSGLNIRYQLRKAVARCCGKAKKVDRQTPQHFWKRFIYDGLSGIADLSRFLEPESR